jgi:hypothetical protein
MTQLFKMKWFKEVSDPPFAFSRHRGWIAGAGILLLLHIAVLGPGIRF